MPVFTHFALTAAIVAAAVSVAHADEAPSPSACGTGGVSHPAPANSHLMPADSYPMLSVVQGEQGSVIFGFTIEPDGSVSNLRMMKSSGFPRLDETAMENVKAWRYKPGQKDGKPVACPWEAQVTWSLHDAPEVFPENGPFGIVHLGPSDYPSSALRRKETGAAAFMVAIDEKGKQMFSTMVRSSGFTDLDGASADYVKNKLNVTPPEVSGRPIASFVNVVLIWSLDSTEQKSK